MYTIDANLIHFIQWQNFSRKIVVYVILVPTLHLHIAPLHHVARQGNSLWLAAFAVDVVVACK